MALLAARSPKLHNALRKAKKAGRAYVVIDGTLIPIDRVASDRPFYSGKHRRHGMNLQVIASPDGNILWVSGPLPGAVHDLAVAPDLGHRAQTGRRRAGVLADEGYHVAGDHIRTLKTWCILRKLRCCPWKAGQLAKAIHVLQARENEG